MSENKRGYKGVYIPAELWETDELTMHEKFFLTEIYYLDNEDGCFAGNKHFSDLFHVSERQVTNVINKLEEKGCITREYLYKAGTKEIDKRVLHVVKFFSGGTEKNFHGGTEKNFRDSITSISKTNKDKENRMDRNGSLPENSPSKTNTKTLDKTLDISIVNRQITRICRDKSVSDDISCLCSRVITYYLEEYCRRFGRDHKILSNQSMSKIIDMVQDGEYAPGIIPDEDTYRKMIDKHFRTDYSKKTDYSIAHFFTAGIIQNRFYEVEETA